MIAQATPRAPDQRGRKVRVSIADDSVVVRGLLSRWLSEAPGVEVVGLHRNGLEAVRQIADIRPDILLLDIEMPEMDGLAALPLILGVSPTTKVLVVSCLSLRGADITLRCLMRGASDYIAKPSALEQGPAEFRAVLLDKVMALAPALAPAPREAGVAPSARQSMALVGRDDDQAHLIQPMLAGRPGAVVIGASTGGPQAVAAFLEGFGAAIRMAPVVVAQHMPATFTRLFADHLCRHAGLDAVELAVGARVEPGRVHICQGGGNIALASRAGGLCAIAAPGGDSRWSPSVNALFLSAAATLGPRALGVVLTGAGDDGAEGAAALRRAGANAIGQDKRSCQVWGMPGAALRANALSALLPADALGRLAARLVHGEQP